MRLLNVILLSGAFGVATVGAFGDSSAQERARDREQVADLTTTPNEVESVPAPVEIAGKLESLGVFKNGIAVVEETFVVPGTGRFATTAPPNPICGTFFVASENARVETTATTAGVAVPLAESGGIDWPTDFAGRWIRVKLPGEDEPRTVRVVPTSKRNAEDESDSAFAADGFGGRNVGAALGSFPASSISAPAPKSRGVLLQTKEGETIWLNSASDVASVSVAPEEARKYLPAVVRVKPRLVFDVSEIAASDDETDAKNENGAKGATIRLFYLTRGASWAPQYRVSLQDDSTLEIEQSAVLANEWRSFENVPVSLFSGFPRIELQDVLSPMAPGSDLNAFFAALANAQAGRGRRSSNLATQQAIMTSNAGITTSNFGDTSDASAAGEGSSDGGVDLFAQTVGLKTLAKGDRTLFSIAKKTVPYRRVVCWNVADARNARGAWISAANGFRSDDSATALYGRTTSGEPALENSNRFEEPWDALQFANPFDFPATTGPATILDGARFLGQNALFWTNPGEETLLPVTKALSVRVRSVENERQIDKAGAGQVQRLETYEPKISPELWGKTVDVWRGGSGRVAVIDATITIANRRNEETTMKLSRQFSGVALPDSFDGFGETAPETVRLGGAAGWNGAVNPRNEIRWTGTLQPNETRTLKFAYQILIFN